jgi:hypothetical protein
MVIVFKLKYQQHPVRDGYYVQAKISAPGEGSRFCLWPYPMLLWVYYQYRYVGVDSP